LTERNPVLKKRIIAFCVFVAWGERGKREKAFNKVKSQLTTKQGVYDT
jgi:hypothetical protein